MLVCVWSVYVCACCILQITGTSKLNLLYHLFILVSGQPSALL